MLRKLSNRRRGSDSRTEDVAKGNKTYVVTHCEAMSIGTIGERAFQSVDGVMSGEQEKIRVAFEKISPYIQEVFTELANHDVRFEFDPVSPDNHRCTMISKHVYSVVCFLKRLPQEHLKVEGNDSDGALTVRLSRKYVQRFDDVCWDDVLCDPDRNGFRYFSTNKLQKVLITSIKHAVDYVMSNHENDHVSIKCSIRKHLMIVGVKVGGSSLNLNILPAVRLGEKIMQVFPVHGKISKILKQFGMTAAESAFHLIAQPVPDYPEKFWRINVNELENKVLIKLSVYNECFTHCLYVLNLLNEKYFHEKKVAMLLPLRYIRMALLVEYLKSPREQQWKPPRLIDRIENTLYRLQTYLTKREFDNLFTGINVFSGREPGTLAELSRNVGHYKSALRGFVLNIGGEPKIKLVNPPED